MYSNVTCNLSVYNSAHKADTKESWIHAILRWITIRKSLLDGDEHIAYVNRLKASKAIVLKSDQPTVSPRGKATKRQKVVNGKPVVLMLWHPTHLSLRVDVDKRLRDSVCPQCLHICCALWHFADEPRPLQVTVLLNVLI
jgi:hypothetical protein